MSHRAEIWLILEGKARSFWWLYKEFPYITIKSRNSCRATNRISRKKNLLLLNIVVYSIIDFFSSFFLSYGHKIIVEHMLLLRKDVSARNERPISAKENFCQS